MPDFLYEFFAPQGTYIPCGMFTKSHLIASLICLAVVVVFLSLYRKIAPSKKMYLFFARLLTVLEIIKISHSFIYGDYYLDAWFPLSYCGLFIFALWIASKGKGRAKRAAEAFIAYGCPIAGLAFLIFPTTSLMNFPIWHYFSLYSLLFHTTMLFCGLMTLKKEKRLNKYTYNHYLIFVFAFSVLAVFINTFYGSNLMNLREPYNIPIGFLQNLYSGFPWGYTLLVFFAYSIIPFSVAFLSRKFKR